MPKATKEDALLVKRAYAANQSSYKATTAPGTKLTDPTEPAAPDKPRSAAETVEPLSVPQITNTQFRPSKGPKDFRSTSEKSTNAPLAVKGAQLTPSVEMKLKQNKPVIDPRDLEEGKDGRDEEDELKAKIPMNHSSIVNQVKAAQAFSYKQLAESEPLDPESLTSPLLTGAGGAAGGAIAGKLIPQLASGLIRNTPAKRTFGIPGAILGGLIGGAGGSLERSRQSMRNLQREIMRGDLAHRGELAPHIRVSQMPKSEKKEKQPKSSAGDTAADRGDKGESKKASALSSVLKAASDQVKPGVVRLASPSETPAKRVPPAEEPEDYNKAKYKKPGRHSTLKRLDKASTLALSDIIKHAVEDIGTAQDADGVPDPQQPGEQSKSKQLMKALGAEDQDTMPAFGENPLGFIGGKSMKGLSSLAERLGWEGGADKLQDWASSPQARNIAGALATILGTAGAGYAAGKLTGGGESKYAADMGEPAAPFNEESTKGLGKYLRGWSPPEALREEAHQRLEQFFRDPR
jgi:hypothetical protein